MKGKIKFSLNLIFVVAILIGATLCFAFTKSSTKDEKDLFTHALATIDNKEYSALLDGDVIFSVEKVSVNTNGNYASSLGDNSHKFYYRTKTNEEEVYFKDIEDNGKSKQVVEDGQFVMLNNQNISGNYINAKTSFSDAIIISLGQYVYSNGSVTYAPNSSVEDNEHTATEYAQLTFIDVSISQNGVKKTDLVYRNVITDDGEPYFDFMYLIAEKDGQDIEGHYVISLTYMIAGEKFSSDFDFYLVCETSYTKTTTSNGQVYTTSPRLGWTKDNEYLEASALEDGFVHYSEGVDGLNVQDNFTSFISYPTITYDYTKYQLSYSLVANRVVTNYNLTYNVKPNTEVEMICSSSGIIEDSKTFQLTNYNKELKLVTVVFTEQGTYNFSFKYLYTGADSALAPSMDKLKIEDKKLVIHGADLNYSKQGYTQAQFRKFVFATNCTAYCNLVIPNGYEQTDDESNIQKYQNNALGLMYKLDDSDYSIATGKSIRVGEVVLQNKTDNEGNVIKNRTEDTLQNYKFQTNTLSQTIGSIKGNSWDSKLNDLEFVKTNQGSMWLTYTDNISETKDNATVDGTTSFYLFNRNKITETSINSAEVKPYNNQTSFNRVGYYVVFVKIKPSYAGEFWQVYAFQYMTDTVDIQVTTVEEKEVGAGEYTNKNVTVSWKDTATFETKINGYYYKLTNNNADRETLLKSTKYSLTKGTQVLGEDVSNNQFAKYLIKLERAGSSATYKIFTIDRQPITGVAAYAIKTRSFGSSVFYEYAINSASQTIQIKNGITNSYSTLDWNDKASGADVEVSYSYTPFVADTSADVEFVNNEWITTKYSLGTTINNCELVKASSKINVGYDSVISGQGIYVFTLTDEAGNATKYMLIIDKTEAYLQVSDSTTTEILPNEAYRLFGKDITYTTGHCKAIKIDTTIIENFEINEILTYLINNTLSNYEDSNGVGYYTLDGKENVNAMQSLFNAYNGTNYITVKNLKVVAYDNYTIDNVCSAYNYPPIGSMVYDKNKLNGATSLYRKLYIVGENTTYTASNKNPNDSNSFVSIEINTDNSRGMVYYSNTTLDINKLPDIGTSSASVKRLLTGSDVIEDEKIKTSGVKGAHASKDKYFAFTWLVGEDKFAVKKVEYEYYSLNLNKFDTNKYFYTANGNAITIFESVPKEGTIVQDGRGFYLFKTDYDNTTKEGLYKITRYYSDDSGDYGDDSYMLTYYYIVDRYGILDVTNQIGINISIGLLNGETSLSGNDFNLISSTPYSLEFDKNQDGVHDIEETFYIYFTTNKVPAILNIPTGKYYNKIGENWQSSNGYYAGQLRISVYYQDIYNQLNKDTNGTIFYQIFEKNIVDNSDYFEIDFYKYLNDNDSAIKDKMICNSTDGKNWLHLKGRYVVVIEDNVETSSSVTNKKLIGFEIKQEEYPNIDVKIGGSKEEVQKVVADNKGQGQYEIVTNQEFVRVELPIYETGGDKTKQAQVDDNYILIKQFYDGTENTYLSVEYEILSQISVDVKLENDSDSGHKYLYLDTKLRDQQGDVIKENLTKSLYYTVTIRYKVGVKDNPTQYQNCYSYITYSGEEWSTVEYCYATYTIIIDRLAPTTNVNQLIRNDVLIKNGYTSTEFEASYYQENQMYFTYQYKNYYNNGKNLNDIYVFRVTDQTKFNNTIDNKIDVAKVYFANIAQDNLTQLTLSLPISTFGGYSSYSGSEISNYGNLFGESYGYYHVLEVDKAGNITQYVVYYTKSGNEQISIPINYMSATGEDARIELGKDKNGDTIELFSLNAGSEINISGDSFFYISLTDVNNLLNDNWQPLNLTTNLATQKNGDNSLTNQIINKIRNRKGSYLLTIVPRAGETYKIGISLYSAEDMIELDVEKLIVKGNPYYINLAGANVTNGNNVFYAKEIIVSEIVEGTLSQKSYDCKIDNGKYNYYCEDTLVPDSLIACKENTTYKLTLTDVFGRVKTTMFNTSGKEFYTITFEDFGNYYIDQQGHYYAYSSATITFDSMFKLDESNVVLTIDNEVKTNISGYVIINGQTVTINQIYNDETGVGSVLNAVLTFKENDGTENRIFNITIDKSIKNASLTDFTTGNNKEFKLFNNRQILSNEDLTKFRANTILSGIMNLSWTRENKQNYSYDYRLYEYKKDSSVVEIDISSVSNKVIDTQEDSFGVYWFVINVYTPNNVLLGNKIYAFEVQQVNSQLYYIKNEQGLAINANAMFTKNDLQDITFNRDINKNNLPNTNMPLYITNQNLDVVLTENVTSYCYTGYISNNELKLYIIDAKTYVLYFGILKVDASTDLVKSVNVNGTEVGTNEFYTFANENKNSMFVFNATDKTLKSGLLTKNILILNVYYNDELVSSNEYIKKDNNTPIEISYIIRGNGSYTFKICDLAGNEHKFANNTNEVELLILREVVVTLNDQVPIDNGYYNDEVSLKVYASTKYVTGSIVVSATRNGVDYTVGTFNPYVFKDYGTYIVKIRATYKDNINNVTYNLTNIVVFTIINEKEAKTSIDLTNMQQYEIAKVSNMNGEDVTSAFKQMINSKKNSMLITHEDVMNHLEELKVSAGKLLFTIEYVVKDNVYPQRNAQIKFTLNDEKPVINCSLKVGETTTKDFNITFNPGIIYEQIGESYIFINGEIAYTIDENAPTEVVEIVRSYKGNGDGDYYITLVGTSGNIWESFKVEIKEPLNTWAIIIIVVVVAVVATVVITIIVLRRKMRIR